MNPGEEERLIDENAVRQFSRMMQDKMAVSRAKGRSGWYRCSEQELRKLLYEHIEKGDPVDVANICMMLRNIQASTAWPPGGREDALAAAVTLAKGSFENIRKLELVSERRSTPR